MDSRNTIINTYLQSAHGLHLHGFTAFFACLQSARLHGLLVCSPRPPDHPYSAARPDLLSGLACLLHGLLACFASRLDSSLLARRLHCLLALLHGRRLAGQEPRTRRERPWRRRPAGCSSLRPPWASGGCRLELVGDVVAAVG